VAGQRAVSGVILFLIAAAGLILLRPEWFPDIRIPTALAEAGWERSALGGFLLVLVGVILTGISMEGGRKRRRGFANYYIPPASPAVEPAAEPEAFAAPRSEAVQTWAPRPSFSRPELVPPPVVEQPEPEATTEQSLESPVQDQAEPLVEPPPPVIDAADEDATVEAAPPAGEPVEDTPAPPAEEKPADADALSEARARTAADPQDLKARIALADVLSGVAAAEESEGRLDGALEHYEESLALHRAAAADAPFDPQLACGLVSALGRLADCREARGHRRRARDLYAEAIRIAQRLTCLTPSEDYAQALAHAEARHAALDSELSPQGQPAQ
jgi:hypothetical protein